MSEATLPITFQSSKQLYSNSDSTIRRRPNEVRALSTIFLPNRVTAQAKSGKLTVKYFYDVNERLGRHIAQEGFDIQLGQRTQKVLSLQVALENPTSFKKRIKSLLTALKSLKGSSESAKKHYRIIASSLEILEPIVLEESL